MKKVLLALASAGALMSAAPANAAKMYYVVEGEFSGGQKLWGNFAVDDSLPSFEHITDVYFTVGDISFGKLFAPVYETPSTTNLWFSGKNDTFPLLILNVNATMGTGFKIGPIMPGKLTSASWFYKSPYETFSLTSGKIGPLGGVPEPSTWIMMMLGFGAVGYSMRRKTTLRFSR